MPVNFDGLEFERPGHATVRVTTDDGRVVYIDPWSPVLGDSPIAADYIFVSHDDYDHYDADAIERVATEETTVVAYERVDTSDLPFDVLEVPADGEAEVNDRINVRAPPAYNDPDSEHVRESGEPFHPEGEVIGLLLTIDDVTVYFASDTDFLDEHADVEADVFIPPIGGSFTMDRHEAAEFTEAVDPDLVIPVHYNTLKDFPEVSDTFEQIETDAEAFKHDVESQTDATVRLI